MKTEIANDDALLREEHRKLIAAASKMLKHRNAILCVVHSREDSLGFCEGWEEMRAVLEGESPVIVEARP